MAKRRDDSENHGDRERDEERVRSPANPDTRVSRVSVPMAGPVEQEATVGELEIDYDDDLGDQIIEEVSTMTLPPNIREIIVKDGVIGDRELFVWRWLYYIFGDVLTLDIVPDEYRRLARDTTYLAGVYMTLLDDVAERHGDRATYWELAKATYPRMTPDWDADDIDSDYAADARKVWEGFEECVQQAPRYEELIDQLLFDIRIVVQGMDFSRMTGEKDQFASRMETWKFESAAIGLHAHWEGDLIFAPEFDKDDYRAFREAAYECQQMWRLGNWMVSWEREVEELDFSAGIFVEAMQQGIISDRELRQLERGEIDADPIVERLKSSGIGERFVADWIRRRDQMYERDFGMNSLDSDELVGRMEHLMKCHLALEKYES